MIPVCYAIIVTMLVFDLALGLGWGALVCAGCLLALTAIDVLTRPRA